MIEILALINARGGSKSIPGKNTALLAGKPMIAWTIEAALESPSITRVVVSTDNSEIAQVARQFGAEVPFCRPSELAQDDTPGIEPVLHAVRWLEEHETYRPTMLMLLQPTSPLRTMEDIEGAVKIARDHEADCVVSVTESATHPFWMKRINTDGTLTNFLPEVEVCSRRQDLPPVYSLNGAVYLIRTNVLLEQKSFSHGRVYGYVMPPERSVDVDAPWDLYVAGLVLNERVKHKNS